MTEGITCYERDEALCEDQMCLRTGCRLRNERLSPSYPGSDELLRELRYHERNFQSLIHGPLCGQAADEIERLRGVAQAPMRADIAQMIDASWKTGKSSSDVAEEILREFDASTVSSTEGK